MYTSSVLNGFAWFCVLCAFVAIAILKSKWPVDKEFCYDIMDGYELAIFHVKEARHFQKDLIFAKRLTPELAYKLERLLDDMGSDFNKMRGIHPQPLIMDSLLETIDSLRLLQKK